MIVFSHPFQAVRDPRVFSPVKRFSTAQIFCSGQAFTVSHILEPRRVERVIAL